MRKLGVTSLIIAIIITGLSWFYTSPLIGSDNRGFPFAYLYTPVVQNPVSTWNYVNLVIDVVIWWIIAFVIMYTLKIMRKKKQSKQDRFFYIKRVVYASICSGLLRDTVI